MRHAIRCLFLALATAAPAAAQDPAPSGWPHWRGPARDGVSHETGWTPVGRAEPSWTARLGRGYSNVSIQDGRLFTLGHDEENGLDRLFCLDADTGEELWRHQWPAELRANFHGGGTLTTPSIDGDVVFASNREGRCFAFRAADGEVLWQRDYAEELGLKLTFHGFSASPLVLPDRLVLVLGGTAVSLDKATGDLQWRTEDYGDGGYSNPVPFELDGARRLAAYFGSGLIVLDAESGAERYSFPWKPKGGGVNVSTPIVMDNRIFISSAYNQGAALIELGDDPEPEMLWRSRRMRNKVSGCTLWQDHIYGFDESMLKCIDLDGQEQWRVRGLGMGSVAVAGGRLLVLTSKGELIVAAASPDGFQELSKRKVLDDGVYWTTPVLLDGRIYCRNSLGHLVCLDHRGSPAAVGSAAGAAADSAADSAGDSATDSAAAAGPAPDAVPDAQSVFETHARATGGEVLSTRSSLHVEGSIEIPGDGVPSTAMKIDMTATGRWRLVYDLGRFGEVQRCFDGEVGWELDPFYGDSLIEGDELRELRETKQLRAPIDWRATYAELETEGRADFADRTCWVVAATSQGGAKRRFYFDVATGRLVGHDGDGESMVVFDDWRDFGGVLLAARTTVIEADTGNESIFRIESAAWDAVEPDVFARPDRVKRLLRTPEEVEAAARAARERYAGYLGTYVGEPPGGKARWTVTIADGDLTVETEQGPMALVPHGGEHRFVLRRSEAFGVEFRADASGRFTTLVFRMGEDAYELTRVD